ncbi:heavy-metal-associated domain-containing protein [Haladaptatus pallidirubidus]|nr:heavy metal-associated domain-containing protein [Haladaptatus pallidirubidus]
MATTITVEGMSCGSCEQTVEDALLNVEGVTTVNVDRSTESATVEGNTNADSLVTVVEDAGYSASA